MTILLDPHLVIEPPHLDPKDERAFWIRLVELGSIRDSRSVVSLGSDCFQWIIAELATLGYPHQRVDFGPADLVQECRTALSKLLARVVEGEVEIQEGDFHPSYCGNEQAKSSLLSDVGAHLPSLHGIFSDSENWEESGSVVSFGKDQLELLFTPGQVPTLCVAQEWKSFFSGRRLHIVGGRRSDSAVRELGKRLGLQSEDIDWVEGSKGKPPRDLDKRWGQLDPDRDIALCLTDRIGHATSNVAEKVTNRRGLVMVYCHGQGRIVDKLIDWARLHSK